ncbi:MAG: hypothetical protein HOC79_04025, partial [Euryarchaeota archaeon]|nr:hypothetical protein [Euryarchaeota archaeon]
FVDSLRQGDDNATEDEQIAAWQQSTGRSRMKPYHHEALRQHRGRRNPTPAEKVAEIAQGGGGEQPLDLGEGEQPLDLGEQPLDIEDGDDDDNNKKKVNPDDFFASNDRPLTDAWSILKRYA